MSQQPPFLNPGHLIPGETYAIPATPHPSPVAAAFLHEAGYRIVTPSPQVVMRAPRPSVCVALFRPGTSGVDVLVHLRADNHLWGLPGGAIEYSESIEQAVRREMQEETGLTGFDIRGIVSVESDPATGAMFSYPDGNTVHYVCVTVLAWIADWEASATQLRASAESLALYWHPYETCQESLPEPFAAVHQRRLAAAWACLNKSSHGLPLG